MHIILNSYGAGLRRDKGNFIVETAEAEQRLDPTQIRSISVGKGAKMTSDAVLLAIEHQIDVLFVDHSGNPQGRVWSIKFGSVSDIRRKQVDFFYGPEALEWVKGLVREKIDNQIALLLTLQIDSVDPLRRRINRGIQAMEDYRNKVITLAAERLEDAAPTLRGWEGAASRKYFELISAYVPEAYRFAGRSQHPATDDFNAMLNYGYGMLYGKIEGVLIRAGVDPYLGIFHRDGYNRPALVYDIIERYRIWVDYVVLQLCRQEAMTEECFRWEGQARMLDGLGKRIVIQSVNDYLAEIIQRDGLRRSRQEHMQREAHALAKFFLEYSPVKLPSER
ncbi:CRISPR-associated endonuclease Cas1 [Neolewinella lacunae]|uniref:CRISPR-associated endonuclease Cas1 n=1 Tax=Neolewinella lacunae TaxID=1517758 RepID=A0A923PPX9_9BACT|nr:CRISPR-associated endonuclease Cas1 [Neolewinella lacunae]MBC6995253.1 CRISPR-associated endonuclease Cas1 [Neolewinella lacunae]MDN3635438.1 CRISPR-associated endonuclease Cas1 [Neolewinella lacunae]